MTFDEQAFKRAWRLRCKERGIDPLQGATSYQVATWKAEQAKAAHRKRASDLTARHFAAHEELVPLGGLTWRVRHDWWSKPEYWFNSPTLRMTHCYTYVPERVPLHSQGGVAEDMAIANVQAKAAERTLARWVEATLNHPRASLEIAFEYFIGGDTIRAAS